MSVGDDTEPLGPEEADDALAAEYVLRLLDPEEERAARAREAADPAFAARVVRWQGDLSLWDEETPPVAPDPAGWRRLERRLFGTPEAERVPPWRRLGLWRGIAAVATAAAAALALLAFAPEAPEAPAGVQPRLVAALAPAEAAAEFLALVEPETGIVRVSRVAGAPGVGRSFEFWLVEPNAPPVSLGLLPDEPAARLELPADLVERLRAGVVLAVSEEPAGGSPTGAPTGPIVAAGPARQL